MLDTASGQQEPYQELALLFHASNTKDMINSTLLHVHNWPIQCAKSPKTRRSHVCNQDTPITTPIFGLMQVGKSCVGRDEKLNFGLRLP